MSTLTAEDRWELADLAARCAWSYDLGDAAAYAALYTSDGRFEREGTPAVAGPEALAAMVQAAHGRGDGYLHVTSNHTLEQDAAGQVEARSYVVLVQAGEGELVLLAVGHYHDLVVRTPDGWRLARRRFAPRAGGLAGALLAAAGRRS